MRFIFVYWLRGKWFVEAESPYIMKAFWCHIYHHFGNWRPFFLYINIIYIVAFGMFFLGLIPKLGGPHFPLGNFQGKNPWEIAGFEARRRCRSCTWAIAIWRGQRNHWIWSCQRCRSWTCDMAINVLMGQKWGGGTKPIYDGARGDQVVWRSLFFVLGSF